MRATAKKRVFSTVRKPQCSVCRLAFRPVKDGQQRRCQPCEAAFGFSRGRSGERPPPPSVDPTREERIRRYQLRETFGLPLFG